MLTMKPSTVIVTRDGHASDLGWVQQDPDPNPDFLIGPRLGSESVGTENFRPGRGSRVWI